MQGVVFVLRNRSSSSRGGSASGLFGRRSGKRKKIFKNLKWQHQSRLRLNSQLRSNKITKLVIVLTWGCAAPLSLPVHRLSLSSGPLRTLLPQTTVPSLSLLHRLLLPFAQIPLPNRFNRFSLQEKKYQKGLIKSRKLCHAKRSLSYPPLVRCRPVPLHRLICLCARCHQAHAFTRRRLNGLLNRRLRRELYKQHLRI